MKPITTFLIIGIIILMIPAVALLQSTTEAAITFILGSVNIKNAGSDQWNRALLQQNITSGNAVNTLAESRSEVTLSGGDGVVRIGENSELTFSEIVKKGDALRSESELRKGKLWMNVKKKIRPDRDNIRLKTPIIVAAIRGTVYRVDASQDTTDLLVYRGQVEVSSTPQMGREEPEGERREVEGPREVAPPVTEVRPPVEEVPLEQWAELIRSGQIIRIAPDGTRQVSTFDARADSLLEWVQWNRERDSIQ